MAKCTITNGKQEIRGFIFLPRGVDSSDGFQDLLPEATQYLGIHGEAVGYKRQQRCCLQWIYSLTFRENRDIHTVSRPASRMLSVSSTITFISITKPLNYNFITALNIYHL